MKHVTVLLNKTIKYLPKVKEGVYFDLTGGAGGHSQLLLDKLGSKIKLYIFDQDLLAIKHLKNKFKNYQNVEIIHANFASLKGYCVEHKITTINGIIADLGLSTDQIDDKKRGFSYMSQNNLDMRMNIESNLLTTDIINNYSYEELKRIFYLYGEINNANLLAKKIIDNRPINDSETLIKICDSIIHSKGHSAKKVFQALRIETNHELDNLNIMLKDATSLLAKNGVLAIISFHSLEDKIVKHYFNSLTKTVIDKNSPIAIEEAKDFILLTPKGIKASSKEIQNNVRAHSAILRAIKKQKN